jgi:hypothetical protein
MAERLEVILRKILAAADLLDPAVQICPHRDSLKNVNV